MIPQVPNLSTDLCGTDFGKFRRSRTMLPQWTMRFVNAPVAWQPDAHRHSAQDSRDAAGELIIARQPGDSHDEYVRRSTAPWLGQDGSGATSYRPDPRPDILVRHLGIRDCISASGGAVCLLGAAGRRADHAVPAERALR